MATAHGYGRLPDPPDPHDYKLLFAPRAVETPPVVRLSQKPQMPKVWDQGQLGSCTAFGSLAVALFVLASQKVRKFTPSWLAQYYWTRGYEGSTSEDAGAYIRDSLRALKNYGIAHAEMWPYRINRFAIEPPLRAVTDADRHQIQAYRAVTQDVNQFRQCLASGKPIVGGFTVFESFESADVAQSGLVPLPAPGEVVVGGHAVAITGYDDSIKMFEVRNSWSAAWGQGGCCWMPYAYWNDPRLAGDFWTVDVVE